MQNKRTKPLKIIREKIKNHRVSMQKSPHLNNNSQKGIQKMTKEKECKKYMQTNKH